MQTGLPRPSKRRLARINGSAIGNFRTWKAELPGEFRCHALYPSDNHMTLTQIVEALLFSAQKPLTAAEIVTAIRGAGEEEHSEPNEHAKVRESEVTAALQQLKIEYVQQTRAFQLVEKAEGWQLATDAQYGAWVRQLFPGPKPARLS